MQKNEWKKVNEVLEVVLTLEPSERSKYYEEAGVDKTLQEEVESLLEFDEKVGSSVNLIATDFVKNFAHLEEGSLIGEEIGEYKLIKELGYGGMGSVYLAERTDGEFNQRVALKLLKREMNHSALRRRFQIERDILASLEHPNIARLLNAGTTKDKIPYIAMEYVEGVPIDKYCNRQNLTLSERLDLFAKVCSAVDFAHRNLVVHRDLKPSNILVTNDGSPKLLDFGISKILTNSLDKSNSATVTKMGMMTPSYASPEQLQSKSVTTATDIYSLGIILYEILSGHRPFEEKEKEVKEIFQAVIETDPPLPSNMAQNNSKVGSRGEDVKEKLADIDSNEANTLATEYKTDENKIKLETNKDPQHLEAQSSEDEAEADYRNSQDEKESESERYTFSNIKPQYLRGDLDNIILKALKKEPERRYSSAKDLQVDIKRHQKGMPVHARPDTFSYRASKFIKRNSYGVAAAGLILFVIIGGLFATLWQARIAQAERVKAENRFNDVRTLANSFLFEISPKIETLSGSLPARKLLVQRALEYLNSLSKESSDDPELQRELAKAYQKVGDLQGNPYNPNIGDIKGALESYEKAFDIREKLLKNDPNNQELKYEVAASLEVLSDLHFNGGDYDKAVTMNEQAIGLVEQVLEEKPDDYEVRTKLAGLLHGQGIIFFSESKNKEAVESYSKSQNIYEQLHKEKPEKAKIADSYFSLFVSIGEAQAWDEDFVNSAKNLQKGLELTIPFAKKHPNDQKIQRSLMLAYFKRAEGYSDVKNFEASEETFLNARKIAETAYNNDKENAQAQRDFVLVNKGLAEALDRAGKNTESLEYLKFGLTLMSALSKKDPNNVQLLVDVASSQYAIGETYLSLKNYDEALKSFTAGDEVLAEALKINPEDILSIRLSSFTLVSIGKCYDLLATGGKKQDFLKKAIEYYTEGLNGLNNLKSQGNLAKEDFDSIKEIQTQIEKVENELSK